VLAYCGASIFKISSYCSHSFIQTPGRSGSESRRNPFAAAVETLARVLVDRHSIGQMLLVPTVLPRVLLRSRLLVASKSLGIFPVPTLDAVTSRDRTCVLRLCGRVNPRLEFGRAYLPIVAIPASFSLPHPTPDHE
jgi:hypothetical protein